MITKFGVLQKKIINIKTYVPNSSPDHLAEYSSILLNYQFEGTDIVYLSRSDRQKITKYRYDLYNNSFDKVVLKVHYLSLSYL